MGTRNDGDPKGSERVASAGPEILNERGQLAQPSQEVQMHRASIPHVLLAVPRGLARADEMCVEKMDGYEPLGVRRSV
jgi:hypothetical protein